MATKDLDRKAKTFRDWYWNNREHHLLKMRENYRKNREERLTKQREYKRNNTEKAKEYQSQYREAFPERYVLNRTRARAKKHGLPFDLEEHDIVIPDTCPVLGLKLEIGSRSNNAKSPSIDKIIPALGYTKGNVHIVSNRANVMKNDATPEELRMFAKWVLKTFPEEPDA